MGLLYALLPPSLSPVLHQFAPLSIKSLALGLTFTGSLFLLSVHHTCLALRLDRRDFQ